MPELYRDSPPRLIQEESTCWAAAAEAYTAKTNGMETVPFVTLIDEGKAAGVVAWNGALRGDDGVKWLAKRLNLQWKSGQGLAVNAVMYPLLQRSYVLFMYRKQTWKVSVHTVLVWGTDTNILATMDPLIGKWSFVDPASYNNSWELCLWKKT